MIPDGFHGILYEFDEEKDFKQDDECWMCHGLCIVTWSGLYHGWLGYCPDCESQWRLS